MQYLVVSDYSFPGLVHIVNELLADGWRPQGGIAVQTIRTAGLSGEHVTIFFQAIVKSDATVEFVLKKAKECRAEFHPVFGECIEREDAEAAKEALEAHQAGETRPWEEVKAELGTGV